MDNYLLLSEINHVDGYGAVRTYHPVLRSLIHDRLRLPYLSAVIQGILSIFS